MLSRAIQRAYLQSDMAETIKNDVTWLDRRIRGYVERVAATGDGISATNGVGGAKEARCEDVPRGMSTNAVAPDIHEPHVHQDETLDVTSVLRKRERTKGRNDTYITWIKIARYIEMNRNPQQGTAVVGCSSVRHAE